MYRPAEQDPMSPPISESVTASTRNCCQNILSAAPTAMRKPISRVRSVTETSMMFMMPMPPTSSETDAMAASEQPGQRLREARRDCRPSRPRLRIERSSAPGTPGAVTLAQELSDLDLGLPLMAELSSDVDRAGSRIWLDCWPGRPSSTCPPPVVRATMATSSWSLSEGEVPLAVSTPTTWRVGIFLMRMTLAQSGRLAEQVPRDRRPSRATSWRHRPRRSRRRSRPRSPGHSRAMKHPA